MFSPFAMHVSGASNEAFVSFSHFRDDFFFPYCKLYTLNSVLANTLKLKKKKIRISESDRGWRLSAGTGEAAQPTSRASRASGDSFFHSVYTCKLCHVDSQAHSAKQVNESVLTLMICQSRVHAYVSF